ncbi:MAG: methionyl-tRNA formyltransferase [Candidatus Izemoplasma sp.]
MKIVFMGTPDFSVPILQAVNELYGVDLVVTQPDKFKGRKKILTPTPVKEFAVANNIPVFQPIRIKDEYSVITDLNPDLIITAAYGQIIPKALLDLPKFGAINVHGSLLPKYRGGAPIQRAILNKEEQTGITIMYMGVKMDSGDIISQQSIDILGTDTTATLFEKLSLIGRDLLIETLPLIFSDKNSRTAQDKSLVTYGYNLRREEELIDWDSSCYDLEAKVRAFYSEPGTYTTLDNKTIKIYKLEILGCEDAIKSHTQNANGEIIKIFKDSIGVKMVDGVIIIKEVQLVGKKRMSVIDFLNGAGRNLITVGKVFK